MQESLDKVRYFVNTEGETTMNLRRRVEEIVDLLEPCLKEGKGVHSMHYETMWGWKTKEGLRASIQAILEKDTEHSEETYQQEESNES